jgi:hypothetical protein
MNIKDNFRTLLEIYRCIILTVIALILLGIYLNTPTPFTIENVRAKKVSLQQIPLVRVQGGSIDIER